MSVYTDSFTKSIVNNPETSLGKITNLINPKSKRIVDLGCASGYFGQFLKEKLNATVWGVEIDVEDAKKAKNKLNNVLIFDLNENNWYQKFGDKKFDTAIFADVIEHLYNPKNALINAKKILNQSGSIIVSVPNIVHQSIALEILFNQWNYEKSGILDQTHLKFFTKDSLIKLVKDSGFYIESIDSTITEYPKQYIKKIFQKNHKKLTPEIFDLINQSDKKNFQYIIKATIKKPKKENIPKNSKIINPQSQWIEEYQMLVDNLTVTTQLKEEISELSNLKFVKLYLLIKKIAKKILKLQK
jgi:2-polyprenyl-3-methyl-5-hydroxy-6-metoxy-1,4-benzoquinol methylase